jgi:hypothetical protein
VLDRLRHLRGDRDEQVDLGVANSRGSRVRTLSAPSSVVRGEDRDREDRLVLVLGQVRELLEARVEVRLRAIITGARSARPRR